MPAAALMLALLVPLLEPLGLPSRASGGAWGGPGTLLGYRPSLAAAAAILGSSLLGCAGRRLRAGRAAGRGLERRAQHRALPLPAAHATAALSASPPAIRPLPNPPTRLLVTLSAFLVIGTSSTLTYNVSSHLKVGRPRSCGGGLAGGRTPAGRLQGACSQPQPRPLPSPAALPAHHPPQQRPPAPRLSPAQKKTVLIIAGGVLLFGDTAGTAKAAGLALAMAGIVAYSFLR
jgi:hypothetical protein